MTLRARVALVLAAVVLLPLVGFAVLLAVTVPRALQGQVRDGLVAARASVSAALAADCERASLAARSLGLELATAEPALATRAVLSAGRVDRAAVLDQSGRVVAEAARRPDLPRPDYASTPSCVDGRATGPELVARVPLQIGPQPQLAWAVTSVTADGAALRSLRVRLGLPDDIVLARDGRVLAATAVPDRAARWARDAGPVPEAGGATVLRSGGDLVAAVGPTAGQPFTLLVARPVPTSTGMRWALAGILAGAVLLAAVVAQWVARRLTRPLVELTGAAERVAGGNFSAAIAPHGEDEVGRLGAAFNNMTAALQLSMSALERSRDEMRASLDRLGEALSRTHDLQGISNVVLDTALSTTGADAGAVLLLDSGRLSLVTSTGLADRGLVVPRDIPLGAGVLGRVVATGQPVRGELGAQVAPLAAEPSRGHVLAVPLRRSRRDVGVLAVYGPEPFAADAEDTVRTLAGHAGIAIDNALLHEEAERLSITDALTGVWNYRYLMMSLNREIERAIRFSRPLAALMLDLDHFKQVNDTFGHERGNVVLRELAQRVLEHSRDVDTLARYGGEEFVLVLPETGVEGAARVAERVCAAVRREPFDADGDAPGLRLTVSIGVAVFPDHGASPATLMNSADQALYRAKRGGRDRWTMAGDAEAAALPQQR